MRFEIARSLNGNKVMYIARDTNGIVRLRKDTEEEIMDAIKKYNENLAAQAEARIKAKAKSKGKGTSVKGKEETLTAEEAIEKTEAADAEGFGEPKEETTEPTTEIQAAIEQPQEVGAASVDDSGEPKKKFLQSDIKEQIEEKKRRSGKKSFWDKLK